jgi:hypothetical protein
VPILKKQSGFVDEIILNADAEPDRVLALGFWKTREGAERYRHEQYKNIHDSLRHLLETEPNIRTFDVHTGPIPLVLLCFSRWTSGGHHLTVEDSTENVLRPLGKPDPPKP